MNEGDRVTVLVDGPNIKYAGNTGTVELVYADGTVLVRLDDKRFGSGYFQSHELTRRNRDG